MNLDKLTFEHTAMTDLTDLTEDSQADQSWYGHIVSSIMIDQLQFNDSIA